jgi:hypothetical protein
VAAAKAERLDTGVGRKPVSGWWVVILTLFLGLQAIVLLTLLLVTWPPSYEGTVTAPPNTQFTLGGTSYTVTREQSLLLMVALAGAVGAMGHVLRSFFRYAGDRKLVWSWVPSYVLIPFVGALMATITYIVLRAGFIGVAGGSLGNPFGFAAVALLVGLFSAQAVEKLKKIFEEIFTTTSQGSNPDEAVETEEGATATAVLTDAATGRTVSATATGGDDGGDGAVTTTVAGPGGGGASTEIGAVSGAAGAAGAATDGHVADAAASGDGSTAVIIGTVDSDAAETAIDDEAGDSEVGAMPATGQADDDDPDDEIPDDADDDEDAAAYETSFENHPDAPDDESAEAEPSAQPIVTSAVPAQEGDR